MNHIQSSYLLNGLSFYQGNKHCVIEWDGREDNNSVVKVTDLSSNGTYVGPWYHPLSTDIPTFFFHRSMVKGLERVVLQSSRKEMKLRLALHNLNHKIIILKTIVRLRCIDHFRSSHISKAIYIVTLPLALQARVSTSSTRCSRSLEKALLRLS